MKALSIRQPWAWLIVAGHKDIENRTWKTAGRGNFLVHASSSMTQKEYNEAKAFVLEIDRTLWLPRPEDLRMGGVVGIVKMTDCVADYGSPWFVGPYGFLLSEPYPLPFRACKGALGFFELEEAGENGVEIHEQEKTEGTESGMMTRRNRGPADVARARRSLTPP